MWHERTSPLEPSSPNRRVGGGGGGGGRRGRGGKRKEKKEEKVFRESVSNFSLNFSVIRRSNPGEPKGKVDPHCKSYAWIPVLWSFDNSER